MYFSVFKSLMNNDSVVPVVRFTGEQQGRSFLIRKVFFVCVNKFKLVKSLDGPIFQGGGTNKGLLINQKSDRSSGR